VTCEGGPIRELREQLADALAPLQIDTYDVLPDQVNPPAIAIGLPRQGPSLSGVGLEVFTTAIDLVGERGDFASAQRRLDELQWETWCLLKAQRLWGLIAEPGSISVAGQDFPGVTFTVESPLPC